MWIFLVWRRSLDAKNNYLKIQDGGPKFKNKQKLNPIAIGNKKTYRDLKM